MAMIAKAVITVEDSLAVSTSNERTRQIFAVEELHLLPQVLFVHVSYQFSGGGICEPTATTHRLFPWLGENVGCGSALNSGG